MMDKTPQVVLATLIQLMAEKMYEPISKVKGWVNVQIEIAVARLYSWVLRRARFPSPLWERDPDWDSNPGLVLAQ